MSIALTAACAVPGAAPGELEAALALLRAGRYAESVVALRAVVQSDPGSGLAWFNLGSAAFNAGDVDEAITAFSRVVEMRSPLAPGARLCLAKCHRRLQRFDEAALALAELGGTPEAAEIADAIRAEAEALAKARKDSGLRRLAVEDFAGAQRELAAALGVLRADVEVEYALGMALVGLGRRSDARERFQHVLAEPAAGAVADEARSFLDRLDSRQGGRPYWAVLDVGAGYESNVYLDGTSSTPITSPILETRLVDGVELGSHSLRARLAHQLYWEETFSSPAGRLLSTTLQLQGLYDDADWTLRLSPGAQYAIFGTTPYLARALAGATVQRNVGETAIGVQAEAGKNYAQASAYQYLNGSTQWISAYFDTLGERIALRFSYSYFVEDIGNLSSDGVILPTADRGHGPGARLLWFPDADWELAVSAVYLFRHYRDAGSPGGRTRDDRQLAVAARVSLALSRALSLFAAVNAVRNTSTYDSTSPVSDRNYTQVLGVTGVSWSVFP